jgi:hypothetical protein
MAVYGVSGTCWPASRLHRICLHMAAQRCTDNVIADHPFQRGPLYSTVQTFHSGINLKLILARLRTAHQESYITVLGCCHTTT